MKKSLLFSLALFAAMGCDSANEDFNEESNADFKYEVLQENNSNGDFAPISYKRQIGIKNKEKETKYFLSITADNDRNLWMLTFDEGVWKNVGNELIHYPVKNGVNDLKLYSIYKDNTGNIWLGAQNSGVFRFDGKSLKKFEI